MGYIRGEIGGSHFDEAAEWERGATAMLNTLDGTDRDNTISVAELHAHVRESAALLSVEGTAEWIAMAIQLPQYAAAFKAARVTALDFPAIVNVPEVLEQELGVSSRLHQQKVLRALKWKLLDLGERPGAPRNLACFCRSDAGVHAVQWSPPVSNGYPPVHGYVVQARRPGERWVGEGVWVYAAVQHDGAGDDLAWYISPRELGTAACDYRVRAWNFHSGGAWASVRCSDCSGWCMGERTGNHFNNGRMALLRSLTWNASAIAVTAVLRWATRYFLGGPVPPSPQPASVIGLIQEVGELAESQSRRMVAATRMLPQANFFDRSNGSDHPDASSADGISISGSRWRRAASQAVEMSRMRRAARERGEGSSRRCHFPDCPQEFKRLSLSSLASSLARHYCRDCQGVYCLQHTRYSPHASYGECGMMSKCLCLQCFDELSHDEQIRLDAVDNKLLRPPQSAS